MKRLLAKITCGIGVLAALHTSVCSAAAGYPSKPVRLIVPGAAGGILDIAARQLSEQVARGLGQPVVVENRPGAGGVAGLEAAARSAPDGYTIVLAAFTDLAVNPALYPKLSYQPLQDFTPVIHAYSGAVVLTAHPSAKVKSLADLADLAKAQPGKHFYGSSGNARPPHVYMELLKSEKNIDVQHVPYNGGPPMITSFMAGDIQFAIEGAPLMVPQIKAGKMIGLAVTSERRLASLPDVPTFTELGISETPTAWSAIMAPRGTPVDVVKRLNQEFAKALESPNVRDAFEAGGRVAGGGAPERVTTLLEADLRRWAQVVKQANIRVD